MSIIAGARERNLVSSVDFTIGAEAANVINVALQFNGTGGDPLTEAVTVLAYLSDNATGLDVAAAGPDGGVAIGTDGDIIAEITASIVFILQTEADGDLDLNLTDAGVLTKHLVVVLPSGDHVVSDAITFA